MRACLRADNGSAHVCESVWVRRYGCVHAAGEPDTQAETHRQTCTLTHVHTHIREGKSNVSKEELTEAAVRLKECFSQHPNFDDIVAGLVENVRGLMFPVLCLSIPRSCPYFPSPLRSVHDIVAEQVGNT